MTFNYIEQDPAVSEWSRTLNTVKTAHDRAAALQAELEAKYRYTYPPTHHNPVEMPSHYTHLPVECIDVTEHFNFCMGNALKYIWRADHKGKPIEDLKKAVWYLQREIERRQ